MGPSIKGSDDADARSFGVGTTNLNIGMGGFFGEAGWSSNSIEQSGFTNEILIKGSVIKSLDIFSFDLGVKYLVYSQMLLSGAITALNQGENVESTSDGTFKGSGSDIFGAINVNVGFLVYFLQQSESDLYAEYAVVSRKYALTSTNVILSCSDFFRSEK